MKEGKRKKRDGKGEKDIIDRWSQRKEKIERSRNKKTVVKDDQGRWRT